MIRIALADDHAVLREGVRMVFEAEEGLTVVGEAADGLEAVDLARRVEPDVMVVDLMMPGLDGLEVTRRVGLVSPRTRVLILSESSEEGYVRRALRSGASGYVVKGESCSQLVEAVRCAVAGICYLSPCVTETYTAPSRPRNRRSRRDPCSELTPREREVLLLAVEGLTSRAIGEQLAISTRTAEAHRANFKRKLGLRSQTELVRFAIKNGILSLED